MKPIYYDLTELYLKSRSKMKYYGIARVVAEIAFEISRVDPQVVFVVFDKARGQFFRIRPKFGTLSANGPVDLGLPSRAVPFRVNSANARQSSLRRAARNLGAVAARFASMAMFPDINSYLEPVTPDDGWLLSAARPKFVADIVRHIKSSGVNVRVAAYVYDMIPLHNHLEITSGFRDSFISDNCVIMQDADLVMTASRSTFNDVCEAVTNGIFPNPARHSVVPLCFECRVDGGLADIIMPPSPYFLGVGITRGRKNLDIVLKAILALLDAGKTPPNFVVAGIDRNRSRKALRQSEFARADPFVHFVNAPSQANLIKLYQNAAATVLASKYEGWGLPLAESLWFGTPGISATNSSLPEVGGALAVYFDQDDPAALAAIFDRFANDADYVAALRAKIAAAKPSLRTWSHVANDLLNTIKAQGN